MMGGRAERMVRASLFAMSLYCVAPMMAQAQPPDPYPNRAVTIVAPAAPGGLYSLFARLIGNKLEQRLGKSFVVENRPGASSIVGVQSVLRAPHDGYTLIVANNTGMAVNVSLVKDLPYDPTRDLVPVALIATIPEVLVVNAATPVRTLAELAARARATPGGMTFGSPGPGTGPHLSGVLLGSLLDAPFTHVPYKGAAPAINDLAGGHIGFMITPVPPALALIQGGTLRAIGVTTAERIEAIPDVPSLRDAGVKGLAESWFMLAAPSGTPPSVVATLNREIRAIAETPDGRAEMVKLGLSPVVTPSPEELKRFVAAEIVRSAEMVKKAGLTPE